MAANDHTDRAWDEQVLRTFTSLGQALERVLAPLVEALPRFDGHVDRYCAASARVDRGERVWVDAPDRPSPPSSGSGCTSTCWRPWASSDDTVVLRTTTAARSRSRPPLSPSVARRGDPPGPTRADHYGAVL